MLRIFDLKNRKAANDKVMPIKKSANKKLYHLAAHRKEIRNFYSVI